MSFKGFPGIADNPGPSHLENFRTFLIRAAALLNRLNRGKANFAIDRSGDGSLTVTLTANAASTTVTDERLSYYSGFSFDPMTANAATEKANGTIYVTQANRLTGSCVITHANNAQTDRTFRMMVFG